MEEAGSTESEEYYSLQTEIDDTKSNIRDIQLYIGYDKQNLQSAANLRQ
jgi:hypothetical protein